MTRGRERDKVRHVPAGGASSLGNSEKTAPRPREHEKGRLRYHEEVSCIAPDTADDTADGEGSGTEETADYASMTDDELKAAITTVEGGKLTVATSPDFAPYEFYAIDENGDPQLGWL